MAGDPARWRPTGARPGAAAASAAGLGSPPTGPPSQYPPYPPPPQQPGGPGRDRHVPDAATATAALAAATAATARPAARVGVADPRCTTTAARTVGARAVVDTDRSRPTGAGGTPRCRLHLRPQRRRHRRRRGSAGTAGLGADPHGEALAGRAGATTSPRAGARRRRARHCRRRRPRDLDRRPSRPHRRASAAAPTGARPWRSASGSPRSQDETTARRCSTPGTRSVNRDQAPGFVALAAEALGSDGASGTHELTATVIDALSEAVQPLTGDGRDHPNSAILPALRRFHDLPPAPTGVRRVPVVTFIESLDAPPVDTHDVYLRLHLLSTRKVRPERAVTRRDLRPAEQRGVDLDGPM